MNAATEYCKSIRKKLHRHPEIGYELEETLSIITEELSKLNIEYKLIPDASSIIAYYKGKGSNLKTIGIRADIDALAIIEDNDLPFKSLNYGKMHACGHDVHASILLSTLKYLVDNKTELDCNVVAIFQAAEEGPTSGGKKIIQTGLVDDVECFFAIHVSPEVDTGKIRLKSGEFNAGCSDFKIEIIGKSGHGAYPQYAVDPIEIGNLIYNAIQSMKTRELNQAQKSVISICSMNAGNNQTNVIPEKMTMVGTVRTYSKDMDRIIQSKMERIVKGICEIYQAKYKFEYINDCIPLINDKETCDYIVNVLSKTLGKNNIIVDETISMGTDDFAFYTDKAKGVMYYLGIRNEEKGCVHSLHNSKFLVDEESFVIGIRTYLDIIMNYRS